MKELIDLTEAVKKDYNGVLGEFGCYNSRGEGEEECIINRIIVRKKNPPRKIKKKKSK